MAWPAERAAELYTRLPALPRTSKLPLWRTKTLQCAVVMLVPPAVARAVASTPRNVLFTTIKVILSSKPRGPRGSTRSRVGLSACTRTVPTTTSQEGHTARAGPVATPNSTHASTGPQPILSVADCIPCLFIPSLIPGELIRPFPAPVVAAEAGVRVTNGGVYAMFGAWKNSLHIDVS